MALTLLNATMFSRGIIAKWAEIQALDETNSAGSG